MTKYTCERCLKEFSQKSHYTKHQNKKIPCQDNKGNIEEVVENIIINKKLISNNTENVITTTMASKQTETPNIVEFEKMNLKQLKSYCKENKIKRYSTYTNKNDLITYIKSNENNTSNAIVSQIKEYKFTREKLDKEKVCLVKGDCLEVMLNIEPKSIDLILCDLPYGVTKNKWDVIISFEKLWEQYNRIIKDNGAIVLFGSQPFTTMLISSNMKYFRYSLPNGKSGAKK